MTIDKITTRDTADEQEAHYRETLRMLRGCDPEAVSPQGEVDVQTITQQLEIVVEHEFGLGSDHETDPNQASGWATECPPGTGASLEDTDG